MPPPLTALVRATGIYPLPSRRWSEMAEGGERICPLPSRRWSAPRVYAPSPHAIGPLRPQVEGAHAAEELRLVEGRCADLTEQLRSAQAVAAEVNQLRGEVRRRK